MDTDRQRPLRILVGADVPPDPNAGASGTILQMSEALRARGHEVETIWQRNLSHHVKHWNLHYLLELPRAYRSAVRKRTSNEAFDVIELNQPHGYAAAADHRRSFRPGVFVIRSQGHEIRIGEELQKWRPNVAPDTRSAPRRVSSAAISRLLARHWDRCAIEADGFVFSCQEDIDFMVQRYGVASDRVGLIPMGVPRSFLNRSVEPLGVDRLHRMLYIGQFSFFKAPDVLAKAVCRILASQPESTMTWLCNRVDHQAVLQLIPAPLRARVQMLTSMPQEKLIDVLDQHGIFLFPSYTEGFGKAPLEAMSRGLCVVATKTAGMKDFITDGTNGRLVPVGDAEGLASAALEVLRRPEEAKRLARAARRTAELYSWERCAQEAEHFYRRLIAKRAGQPCSSRK